MSDFLLENNVALTATCGAITVTEADDGLVDYQLARTNKTTNLSDNESVNGTAVVKMKTSKSGTLTLTVNRGTDLETKLTNCCDLLLPFVGTIMDTRNSSQTKNTSFIGGISKPDIQYSADTLDFEVAGNFQDINI